MVRRFTKDLQNVQRDQDQEGYCVNDKAPQKSADNEVDRRSTRGRTCQPKNANMDQAKAK